jgi:hypothetical protein
MNKPFARFALFVTFGFAIMQLPARTAGAADERTCRDYASGAIAQQNDNLNRGCGFSGSWWNTDYYYHYNWCSKVPNDQVAWGMNVRATALQSCSR